jgi:hypothetical protein
MLFDPIQIQHLFSRIGHCIVYLYIFLWHLILHLRDFILLVYIFYSPPYRYLPPPLRPPPLSIKILYFVCVNWGEGSSFILPVEWNIIILLIQHLVMVICISSCFKLLKYDLNYNFFFLFIIVFLLSCV